MNEEKVPFISSNPPYQPIPQQPYISEQPYILEQPSHNTHFIQVIKERRNKKPLYFISLVCSFFLIVAIILDIGSYVSLQNCAFGDAFKGFHYCGTASVLAYCSLIFFGLTLLTCCVCCCFICGFAFS